MPLIKNSVYSASLETETGGTFLTTGIKPTKVSTNSTTQWAQKKEARIMPRLSSLDSLTISNPTAPYPSIIAYKILRNCTNTNSSLKRIKSISIPKPTKNIWRRSLNQNQKNRKVQDRIFFNPSGKSLPINSHVSPILSSFQINPPTLSIFPTVGENMSDLILKFLEEEVQTILLVL